MAKRGKYIVIEGQDGTGKSTQVSRLIKRLKQSGIDAIEFHEPGEADDSIRTMPNSIRGLIKDKDVSRVPSTNIALFSASRNELWKRPKGAREALEQGVWVIASRNWHSTLAYQGYGEGEDIEHIEKATLAIVGKDYLVPDYECILFLDENERLSRLSSRDDMSVKDTFESKPSDFQRRVNDSYLEIAKKYQLDLIDGYGSPEEVEEKIAKSIEKDLKVSL